MLDRFLWPSNSCTVRISVTFISSVAKVCRKVCGVQYMPQAVNAAELMIRSTDRVVIIPPFGLFGKAGQLNICSAVGL